MKNDVIYTEEAKEVLTYMVEILSAEFPNDAFTPEYLITAILDNKKCHANVILDSCLMTHNIEELKKIYTSYLYDHKREIRLPSLQPNRVRFTKELDTIVTNASEECNKYRGQAVGSEHFLLSMLNPKNDCKKIQEVFRNVGIDYQFIMSKSKDLIKNNTRSNKPKELNLGQPSVQSANHGNYITQYTVNINEQYRKGLLDSLIGREREMNLIIKTLARRKKNNVMLVGQGGVGCTTIAHGLAEKIEKGEVPEILIGKELVQLNVMAMVSGTHFRGMFEERVKGLIEDLKRSAKYILVLDDIQQMLKSNKEKDTDISPMIGEILSGGEVQIIGTTNFKDYKNSVEKNSSLSHKFQKIVIEPNSKLESINIINNIKHYYEDYHNVYFNNNIITKAVELADRYITNRSLPDSAIDVIDLSGAHANLKRQEVSEKKTIRQQLQDIEKQRLQLLNNGKFEEVDNLFKEEQALKQQLADFDRKEETNKKENIINITEEDIALSVSEITNIPVNKLNIEEKERLSQIENILKASIIGQDDAINKVCRIVKRNKVGLSNSSKIAGTILAVGKSGCGKTLLAKKLAEEIYGDKNALVRIDMSEYSEKSSVSKLCGSSPGYVGYENGGQLTEAIKNKPYCVLLLDEIEKANEEVYNIFLQVFDEGRLTDGSGQLIDFKNVMVIMTSNVGTKQASDFSGGIGFSSDKARNSLSIIEKEIKNKFKPEFINRIDQIVHFNDLTSENLKDIINLEIGHFNKRLNNLSYDLKWDNDVVEYILKRADEQRELGARPIIRLIQDNIEDKITDLLLNNTYEKNYVFVANVVNESVNVV